MDTVLLILSCFYANKLFDMWTYGKTKELPPSPNMNFQTSVDNLAILTIFTVFNATECSKMKYPLWHLSY
jgi:hypothetical protein